MRKHKKTIGLLLAAILLVGGTFLATMAYLTSQDEVKNTFTVGQVKIKLDEADVNLDGVPIDEDGKPVDIEEADRVKANTYKLLPGRKYTKDPTVTVLGGSEESFVRIRVSINKQGVLDDLFKNQGMLDFFGGYEPDKWKYVGFKKVEDVRTYEFRYFETVAAPSGDVALDPLFNSIIIPGEGLDSEGLAKLEGLNIDVVAQAIQASGFNDDVAAAWAAFDLQHPAP